MTWINKGGGYYSICNTAKIDMPSEAVPDEAVRPSWPAQPAAATVRLAHLEAAISADSNIDGGAIEIRMLRPCSLEGYITSALDREKAISLAAMIVGLRTATTGCRAASHAVERYFRRLGLRSMKHTH